MSRKAATTAAVDYELLRRAGEHLGTLAEDAYERMLHHERTTIWSNSTFARDAYQQHAKLSRLSKELLELVRKD